MIDTIPSFPCGVNVGEALLEDRNMKQTYSMNATAMDFLSLIDGKQSLASISAVIARQYQIPQQDALQDMLVLSRQLHSHSLLNIKETWKQALTRLSVSARSRTIMLGYAWRYDVPNTSNFMWLFLWVCTIVTRVFLPFILLSSLCLAIFAFSLNLVQVISPLYLLIWICIIVSISLHETGHLAALRWKQGKEVGFVVCSGFSIHICRPPVMNVATELLISLAGPLIPTFVAILLLILHFVHGFWFDWVPIAIFGIHSFQLVFPNHDIRNITRMLRTNKQKA